MLREAPRKTPPMEEKVFYRLTLSPGVSINKAKEHFYENCVIVYLEWFQLLAPLSCSSLASIITTLIKAKRRRKARREARKKNLFVCWRRWWQEDSISVIVRKAKYERSKARQRQRRAFLSSLVHSTSSSFPRWKEYITSLTWNNKSGGRRGTKNYFRRERKTTETVGGAEQTFFRTVRRDG